MSNKNKNKVQARPTGVGTKNKQQAAPVSQNKPQINKNAIKITAIILAAAILLGAIITAVILIVKDLRTTDYMKDDLSKYITLNESDYTNILIDKPFESYEEMDLIQRINKLLAENKSEKPLYDGHGAKTVAITLGDIVSFYYRGYTVDANGKQTDFTGGSNVSGDEVKVEVGSNLVIVEDSTQVSYFIPGFMDGMIGKVPNDYAPFKKITSGTVAEGDVAYISYTVYHPGNSGTAKSVSYERINLNDEDIDTRYGTGFKAFLLGTAEGTEPAKIGEKLGSKTFPYDKGSAGYSDLKVEFVTRGCEDSPLTIDVRFPADYSEADLRGKDVKFDVYISSAVIYDTPEFNEEFITKTLKVSEESLADYAGDTVVDKYKAHLEKIIKEEIKDINDGVISDAIWERLFAATKVNSLPEDTVQEYYDSYYQEIAYGYQQNSTTYENIDAYALKYLGLSSGTDWRAYIRATAENVTLEKVIFYYVIREQGYIPSDSEYRDLYDEIYAEHLDYYINLHAEELEGLNDAQYAKELESIKKELNSYYSEEYFAETVYYEYGTAKMIEGLARLADK